MYIVSMTTIPSRKSTLVRNLNSLLKQNFNFDKIVINIDDHMSFFEYEFYFGLKNLDERIEVNICDRKWRSCNKLLPTLKKYPEDVIITVDDDICYPDGTLKSIVEEYEKNKDCIITAASNPIVINEKGEYCGYYYLDNEICLQQKNYSKYMTLCCLFPPNVFDGTEVFDYEKMIAVTNGNHDELWFWLNSTLKKTKVITTNFLMNIECYITEETYGDGNKLSNINIEENVLNWYIEKINEFYGKKLNDIFSEKIEFVITHENMYTLFYNWDLFKKFYYDNFVLNCEKLTKGMVIEIEKFLRYKGVDSNKVIKV